MEAQLIYNAVECLSCGDILESYHRHDYKTCNCSNKTNVDGGYDYLSYGGKDMSLIKSIPLYSNASHEQIREKVKRGGRGIDGRQPLKYVLLKDVDDEWLQAIIKYEEEHLPSNRFLPIYRNEKLWRQDTH